MPGCPRCYCKNTIWLINWTLFQTITDTPGVRPPALFLFFLFFPKHLLDFTNTSYFFPAVNINYEQFKLVFVNTVPTGDGEECKTNLQRWRQMEVFECPDTVIYFFLLAQIHFCYQSVHSWNIKVTIGTQVLNFPMDRWIYVSIYLKVKEYI